MTNTQPTSRASSSRFRPALWSCVVFAALAAATAAGITAAPRPAGAGTHAADVPVAARFTEPKGTNNARHPAPHQRAA